ncbi:hypothetical protein QTP86_029807 [Hemibagrus guttatus]|nr:hypothetical protein QTP86_029807 [Hemibagrus guttatus]
MSVNLSRSVNSIVTPSARDLSQDCTSMIMPSGVSSFLLDCMASDLEAGDPLPSIETLCKADTYELSPVIDGQTAKESFSLTPPEPVSPIGSLPLVGPCEYLTSEKNTSGGKRTPVTKIVVAVSPVVKKKPFTGKRKPIKCRKVTFSDVISMQTISMLRPGSVTPQRRPYNVHKNDMRRNTKEASSETARFFDFADECEKEAFFQRLKLTHTFQLPAKLITFTDLPRNVDV